MRRLVCSDSDMLGSLSRRTPEPRQGGLSESAAPPTGLTDNDLRWLRCGQYTPGRAAGFSAARFGLRCGGKRPMPHTAEHAYPDHPAWGETPWEIAVALPFVPLPRRCDAVVVGAGFAGLSVAYHLARRGARVTVLEASTVGAGASGRTGGLVLEGTAAGPLEQVEHCLDAISAVVQEAGIDCDLTLPGCA